MNRQTGSSCLITLGAVLTGGCQELINPFQDDLPFSSEVSTASVLGVRHADVEPAQRNRGWQPAFTAAQDGTVSHWPLWWEDPVVDERSEDDWFAWTAEDYLAFPYGLGRSLVNTMGWPASVAMHPPWTLMGSDGVPNRPVFGSLHDAAPLPGGLAPPIDVLEVGTIPADAPAAESAR